MKNFLLISALAILLSACNNKEDTGCDSTKYNCAPVSSVSSEVVISSEPVETADLDTAETVQEEVLPKAPSSKEILNMINIEKETLIKNEMNELMGTNYNGWNVMVNSVKPDPRDPNNMWIVNYDVSTGEKGMLSNECEAKAFLSGEDNTTLILATIDTECYSFLKQYVD